MGNLFGVRRRAPQVTAQDRAVLQLKQQRDKIKIYQKRTEAELIKSAELAVELFKKGLKDRALVIMRRKKQMEDIINRTDKQLETLEQLVADIEYTQIEVSVVEGLKVGSEALKQLNSLMNIDDIQQMMDDNAEAAEKQREISDILSKSSERYDEDDLLRDLEKYQTTTDTPKEIESSAAKTTTPEKIVEMATEITPEAIIEQTSSEQVEDITSDLDNLPETGTILPDSGEVVDEHGNDVRDETSPRGRKKSKIETRVPMLEE